MDTFFTVKNQDLERLSPSEAVDFFRELLWAEASVIGIGKNLINVPSAITVSDGGVDAEVTEAPMGAGQGIIKPGLTRYQIKTGSFSLKGLKSTRGILFNSKSTELKPRVKSCLDNDGTLIVVLFGWDDPDRTENQLVEKFRETLTKLNRAYERARIEVWRQNVLIGFLNGFPSLSLMVTERDKMRFQTYQSWSQDAEMKKPFKAGEVQLKFISKVQDELRRNDEAVHVRIWGEPGIGKTRLILEAVHQDDIEPLVIYCDSATKFRDSDLMNEILKVDNSFFVVLVLDECDPDNRSYIWDKLKYRGPRIKLVSIYNEFDDTSGAIIYLDPPFLEAEYTSAIIQSYAIAKDQAERWAEICSGSPRVAHVIGWNLKSNPQDLLKTPDTVNIWDRYIAGGDRLNSEGTLQKKLVLRYLALWKRFGYGEHVVAEAKLIAKVIEQADVSITWPRFQEIIQQLRARRLLQGENTLYISPKALHIKLWVEWWETYGVGFNVKDFSKSLNPQLLAWFYDMFKYAVESEVAQRIVKKLLGPEGPFANDGYLKTSLGARFFLALTEGNPEAALEFLTNTIGKFSKDELLQFTTGRREVVWALQRIVVWKNLFVEGAGLLLLLAEAENETWGNNASGVFADLFSPGYGKVAPTEASPEERFPVLEEALRSDSKTRRLLALSACNKALESGHFTRMAGPERQGLRQEAQLWMPKTWGELFDAYRRVWGLLRQRLQQLDDDEKQEAIQIILQKSRGLLKISMLGEMVLSTLQELATDAFVDKKKVLQAIIQILHYDGKTLPPETRQWLENIRDNLIGNDFPSLMQRYVGMDLLEDKFDEEGKRVDQTDERIDSLVQQAIENCELLKPELSWLVTNEAQNGFRFGYKLGLRDTNLSLLPLIFEAYRNSVKISTAYFLGGYFRAVRESDPNKWEKLLDDLVADVELRTLVPEVTWRSGMSDRAAVRLLELVKQKIVHFQQLRLFAYGSVIRDLSENVFLKWIELLLQTNDRSALSIALNLHYFYYIDKRGQLLPEKLTLTLLTHPSLFRPIEQSQTDQMDEYYWSETGKAYVEHYPKQSLEIAARYLEHFGESRTIVGGFHSSTQQVLNEIVRRHPSEAWDLIRDYLGSPIDTRAFHIKEWLCGGEFYAEGTGALGFIPAQKVWAWVDEDIEKRAWYLASFVPNLLFREAGRICWAREVLIRYGDRKDVRRNLRANFSTEGWSGSESQHYEAKKQGLINFRQGETNRNVQRWIDEYVQMLDGQIQQAKLEEEREHF